MSEPQSKVDGCHVMQVIRNTCTRRGDGTPGDPYRVITQYFTLEGTLLAEADPTGARSLEKGEALAAAAEALAAAALKVGAHLNTGNGVSMEMISALNLAVNDAAKASSEYRSVTCDHLY